MENGVVERRCPEIVMAEILIGDTGNFKMRYLALIITTKQVYYLLAFLVARRWRLVTAFFCQFLFQAAFAITMHHWFIPVFAEIFSYIVFIGIILGYNYNLAKGLQQYAQTGCYGY